MPSRVIRYVKQARHPLAVQEAWRLLADTDHLNRTVGLPSVEFTPIDPARGELIRRATGRAYGLVPVRWREYPFDWVRNQRYVVRREFEWGPIAVVEVGIKLEPAPEGTQVAVYADFTPANVSGRLLWRLLAPTVDGMSEFCQEYLARKAAGKADPTPVRSERARVDKTRLEEMLKQLASRNVQDDLLRAVRERITEGSDDQLFRMRPFELADLWGADRQDVLRLFLQGASIGLFGLQWQLLCPTCRVPKDERRSLTELPNRFHCDVCGIDFAAELDQRVELRFSVDPAVRRAEDSLYCVGSPVRTPHVMAQQYLRPHESRLLELDLSEPIRLRAIGGRHEAILEPHDGARWIPELSLIYADGRWSGPHSLAMGDDLYAIPKSTKVNLRNQTEGPILAVVEELAWSSRAATAAEVLALPLMHELFPDQVPSAVAGALLVTAREVAVLYCQVKRSLFDSRDAKTVAESVELLSRFLRQRYGQAPTTEALQISGDSALIVFKDVTSAIEAAVRIQTEIGPWCVAEGTPAQTLRTAVYRGPAVVVDHGGSTEYLGRAVTRAAELARASRGGDVVTLLSIYGEALPTLAASMRGVRVEELSRPSQADASQGIQLVRLALDSAERAPQRALGSDQRS